MQSIFRPQNKYDTKITLCYRTVKKNESVRQKGENAVYQYFPLFPHCF